MKQLKKVVSLVLIAVVSFFNLWIVESAEAKAGKKFTVELVKCIDGDTARFTKVDKTRFLYIDTPESTNTIEKYGEEAAEYTCSKLTNAKKIQLQYDGDKKDKYERTLAWVWVDGKLLQKNLIVKGYVKKFYDYGTYSYESELIKAQKKAKKNKVGYWSEETDSTSTSK